MVRLPTSIPTRGDGRHDFYKNAAGIRGLQEYVLANQRPVNIDITSPDFIQEPVQKLLEYAFETSPGMKTWQRIEVEDNPPEGDKGEWFEKWGKTYYALDAAHFFIENRAALTNAFITAFEYIVERFAPIERCAAKEGEASLFTVPAYELLPDAKQTVLDIVQLFMGRPYGYSSMFFMLGNDLEANIRHHHPDRPFIVDPKDVSKLSSKLSTKELIEEFFHGTPILNLFKQPVPVAWRFKERSSHTHVIGRTDTGKTTLLERMIHQDLLDPAKPSLVVMTPHGDLIRSLKNLAASERMLVIDPTDTKYPPAINPFSTKRKLPPNAVIQTFDYILESLGLDLTPKQRSLWKATVRMLLTLPKVRGRNATIADIRDFMLKPESYTDVIDRLDDPSFFRDNVLNAKSKFDSTREEVGYRIGDVLGDPDIRRILVAEETKVDFYEELNRGSVILIDTAKRELADGSSLFGGMMLALIFQAIFARDAIFNENQRHQTFVYVDEASNYFSSDLSAMLTEVRKFRCSLIFAHHELQQAKDKSAALAKSLVSQPGIRFAHPSADDAPELAREMNTSPDQLRNLPDYHFAAFIRGLTPHPVPVKLKRLAMPRMTVAQREAFKWANRDRVSFGTPKASNVVPLRAPDADDSEWV